MLKRRLLNLGSSGLFSIVSYARAREESLFVLLYMVMFLLMANRVSCIYVPLAADGCALLSVRRSRSSTAFSFSRMNESSNYNVRLDVMNPVRGVDGYEL